VPTKDEEALIAEELQSADFLSLPLRPDDHYATAAFAAARPTEVRRQAHAGGERVPEHVRGRAFDLLRPRTPALVVGHVGTAHERRGELGRARGRVHVSLDLERRRRQEAGYETEVPRNPRPPKRDTAARKRQERRKPAWRRRKRPPAGDDEPAAWLIGLARPGTHRAHSSSSAEEDEKANEPPPVPDPAAGRRGRSSHSMSPAE
jgi:hypothetical protein